jgi:hypothetical protein
MRSLCSLRPGGFMGVLKKSGAGTRHIMMSGGESHGFMFWIYCCAYIYR